MRSSWKGSIGFGMLSIPVNLAGAVNDNGDIELHQHAPDGSRIRYKRVSSATGEEVEYKDIRKGYECADGNTVFLTDDDFEAAYGKISREAVILMFAKASDVPDIAKSKPFFIQPQKGAEKAYAVLVQALRKSGTVAVVQVGMRQRKRLATVSPTEDGYLILEQLEWHEDIRKPDFSAPANAVSDSETDMAVNLIETMTQTFTHAEWRDDSREKLNEMIAKRIELGQVTGTGTADKNTGQAVDLMSVLAASVKANTKPAPKTRQARTRKAS